MRTLPNTPLYLKHFFSLGARLDLFHTGLDWPLCHCAVAQAPPPFDEHRRPLAPSNFFDNNGNNFS